MGWSHTKTNKGKLILNQTEEKLFNLLLSSPVVIRCPPCYTKWRAIQLQFIVTGLLTQRKMSLSEHLISWYYRKCCTGKAEVLKYLTSPLCFSGEFELQITEIFQFLGQGTPSSSTAAAGASSVTSLGAPKLGIMEAWQYPDGSCAKGLIAQLPKLLAFYSTNIFWVTIQVCIPICLHNVGFDTENTEHAFTLN